MEAWMVWLYLLWSYETKIKLFEHNNRIAVWRRWESYNKNNIISTNKQCCEVVSFLNALRIKWTVQKETYLDVLKKNLKTSVKQLGLGHRWIFIQDMTDSKTGIKRNIIFMVGTKDKGKSKKAIWFEETGRIRVWRLGYNSFSPVPEATSKVP